MRICSTDELCRFSNHKELEAAYNESPFLEVRAGIVHSLSTSGAPGKTDWYHEEQFPLKWRLAFLLRVCRECMQTYKQVKEKASSIPEPGTATDRVGRIGLGRRKSELQYRLNPLMRMASTAIVQLMNFYLRYAQSLHRASTGNEDVDRATEQVLDLLSSWEFATFLSLRSGAIKRRSEDFLRRYGEKQAAHLGELSEAWFKAVIQTDNLAVFDCLRYVSTEEVARAVADYLTESSVQDGFEKGPKTPLSELAYTNKWDWRFSKNPARWLVTFLLRRGTLDEVLSLDSIKLWA